MGKEWKERRAKGGVWTQTEKGKGRSVDPDREGQREECGPRQRRAKGGVSTQTEKGKGRSVDPDREEA